MAKTLDFILRPRTVPVAAPLYPAPMPMEDASDDVVRGSGPPTKRSRSARVSSSVRTVAGRERDKLT